MSTYREHFFVGLKNPRSVRVDVTVEIKGHIKHDPYRFYLEGDSSDFDPRLFEALWQGIGAKILEERKK